MKILLASILLCLILPSGSNCGEPQAFRAWISLEREGDHYVVKAFAQTMRKGKYRFALHALKDGGSGSSASRQSGAKLLHASETQLLSILRLSRDSSSDYHIELKLYQNGELVAEDLLLLHKTADTGT